MESRLCTDGCRSAEHILPAHYQKEKGFDREAEELVVEKGPEGVQMCSRRRSEGPLMGSRLSTDGCRFAEQHISTQPW